MNYNFNVSDKCLPFPTLMDMFVSLSEGKQDMLCEILYALSLVQNQEDIDDRDTFLESKNHPAQKKIDSGGYLY